MKAFYLPAAGTPPALLRAIVHELEQGRRVAVVGPGSKVFIHEPQRKTPGREAGGKVLADRAT
jgi:hypothetical protein